ncbi:MAG: Zn-dependent hydrolase [Chloroflexi bacterium]|nr:Zn-dependent hydrolase [Chloroflexota bacterium]
MTVADPAAVTYPERCDEGADLQTLDSTIPKLRIDSDRLRADFEALRHIGLTHDGGVNRLALSAEDLAARAWFADRIEEAGLRVCDDDAGNLGAVLPSPDPGAKTLLIGSHLDSVPNGGHYDGTIGVLAALECLRTIHDAGLVLPIHLEAINFTDDEGCWMSMMGSRALIGALNAEAFNDVPEDDGQIRAALRLAGIDLDTVEQAARDPEAVLGFLELHVEQSSRLERANVPIGVVTGIVGRRTYQLTFTGSAGHSGTTDMYKRRDALRGAAMFIVRAHDVVREAYGDGIFNCGDIDVEPGSFNIIPSSACIDVEIRHYKPELLAEMETALFKIARECAAVCALEVESKRMLSRPAATMAAGMIQAIESACVTLGLDHLPLVSYAGHTAQMLSLFTHSGMIFVPSVGGIGHHPDEFTHWDDVVNGANVLLQTVLDLAYGGVPGTLT